MIFILLLLSVCTFLAVERTRHRRRLSRIPIRIHVNGTRGKSNVTRLIAASLRRAGVRTLAKTTGTTPRLILPDGTEKPIRRLAPANILEQVRTIGIADRMQATAVVIECMALDPMLQFVSEREMIRSTVGVITNVRPDHFEVMGDSLDDIAEALSGTIPENGVLITGDSSYHPFFASVAAARGTRAVLADGADEDLEPAGFPADSPAGRFWFRENIAIARSVLRLLGLDPACVSPCLDREALARESAGVSWARLDDREVHFVDAFSANDVTSTKIIQDRAAASFALPRPRVALFNNRADRPLRMQSFALSLLGDPFYDYVAVIGECRGLARRFIGRKSPAEKVLVLGGRTPAEVLDELFAKIPGGACTIVGMGNEKGPGRLLANHLEGKAPR